MVLGPPVGDRFTESGMPYYTQMPASDDSPAERDFGIVLRGPRETLADTVAAIQS